MSEADKATGKRYPWLFLRSSQTADCLHCDMHIQADEPGDLDALLEAIDSHKCDMGPFKGNHPDS